MCPANIGVCIHTCNKVLSSNIWTSHHNPCVLKTHSHHTKIIKYYYNPLNIPDLWHRKKTIVFENKILRKMYALTNKNEVWSLCLQNSPSTIWSLPFEVYLGSWWWGMISIKQVIMWGMTQITNAGNVCWRWELGWTWTWSMKEVPQRSEHQGMETQYPSHSSVHKQMDEGY